jgi:hypothetical protein
MDTSASLDLMNHCKHGWSEAKIMIPFKIFANPVPTVPHSPVFTLLLDLPLELLMIIFEMCDASTKYQWMRVSRLFRSITIKHFWDDPNLWFEIPDDWQMRPYNYACSKSIGFDPAFAKNIKQAYLYLDEPSITNADVRSSDIEYQVEHFWRSIKKGFPSVRSIIIGYHAFWMQPNFDLILSIDDIHTQTDNPKHFDLCYYLKSAPRNIKVVITCQEYREEAVHGPLFCLDSDRIYLQEIKVEMPSLVLIPRRPLCAGIFADFQHMLQLQYAAALDDFGADDLILRSHLAPETTSIWSACPNKRCSKLMSNEMLKLHWRENDECNKAGRQDYGPYGALYIPVVKAKRERVQEFEKAAHQLWWKIRHQLCIKCESVAEHSSHDFSSLAEQAYGGWTFGGYMEDLVDKFKIEYFYSEWAEHKLCVWDKEAANDIWDEMYEIEDNIAMIERYDEFWSKAGFVFLTREPRLSGIIGSGERQGSLS